MKTTYIDDKVAKEYYTNLNNNLTIDKNISINNYEIPYKKYLDMLVNNKVVNENDLKERILKLKPYEYSDLNLKTLDDMIKDSYLPKDYKKHGIFAKLGTNIIEVVPTLVPKRVSSNVLGPGVLGRWWVGTDYAEILETLWGEDFEAVLDHENYHALNPLAPESRARERTKELFPGFFTKMLYGNIN